jgi:hypothetical protein
MALAIEMNVTGSLRLDTTIGSFDQGTSTANINAIARVVSINGSKSHAVAEVVIEGNGFRGVQFIGIPMSVVDGAPNFIRQAYLHLKTLPEFANATDC